MSKEHGGGGGATYQPGGVVEIDMGGGQVVSVRVTPEKMAVLRRCKAALDAGRAPAAADLDLIQVLFREDEERDAVRPC